MQNSKIKMIPWIMMTRYYKINKIMLTWLGFYWTMGGHILVGVVFVRATYPKDTSSRLCGLQR